MNRKEYNLLVEGWNNYLRYSHYENDNEEILNEGIFDEIKSRFGNLKDGLKNREFKDTIEVVIESLAPDLTLAIREAQIDLHVKDWKDGFETRNAELAMGSGGYPSSGNITNEYDDSKSDDWNAGYAFRSNNPGDEWDDELEKMVVEKGIEEWNDLVEINVVKTSAKDFINLLNPVELYKHLKHAIKKHGLQVALPIVVAEIVMHGLPVWGSKLLGPKAAFIISQIPITELLTPIYLKHVTGEAGKEPEPGYLDNYEAKYGSVDL